MNKKLIKVILILCLLSLYGVSTPLSQNDNNLSNEKEIGRLFSPLKGWQYNDFTFSNNGKFLYTYKNKSLYIWKFLPKIEYIGSFYIGVIKNKKNTSFMHIVPNNKMIFRISNSIELWNLRTMKKVLKQKIESISGVSTEDGFVILNKNKNLKKLDFNTLKTIQQNEIKNHCVGIEVENTTIDSCECFKLLYINNTINIVCQYYLSSVKSKTLDETSFSYFNPTYSYLSTDNKYIHSVLLRSKSINSASCTKKQLNQNESKLSNIRDINKKSFIFKSLLVKEKEFSNGLKVLSLFIINQNHKTKKRMGYFAHDINGDWIFKQSGNFYFDTSLSLEKLKMKLLNERVSPMNSQTYNKYYKKINFKELNYGKR